MIPQMLMLVLGKPIKFYSKVWHTSSFSVVKQNFRLSKGALNDSVWLKKITSRSYRTVSAGKKRPLTTHERWFKNISHISNFCLWFQMLIDPLLIISVDMWPKSNAHAMFLWRPRRLTNVLGTFSLGHASTEIQVFFENETKQRRLVNDLFII